MSSSRQLIFIDASLTNYSRVLRRHKFCLIRRFPNWLNEDSFGPKEILNNSLCLRCLKTTRSPGWSVPMTSVVARKETAIGIGDPRVPLRHRFYSLLLPCFHNKTRNEWKETLYILSAPREMEMRSSAVSIQCRRYNLILTYLQERRKTGE